MANSENNNMYRIVGIIDGHYAVETSEGVRKVKITKSNKKTGDEVCYERWEILQQ